MITNDQRCRLPLVATGFDRQPSSVYAGAQRPHGPKWALGACGSHGFGGSNALGSGVCETDALAEDGKGPRWIFGIKPSRKVH